MHIKNQSPALFFWIPTIASDPVFLLTRQPFTWAAWVKICVCFTYRIYPFETFEFFCSCIRGNCISAPYLCAVCWSRIPKYFFQLQAADFGGGLLNEHELTKTNQTWPSLTGGVSYTVGGATSPPTFMFAPPTLCSGLCPTNFCQIYRLLASKVTLSTIGSQSHLIRRLFGTSYLVC